VERNPGTEPDRPRHVQGASRGKDDPRDAEGAGSGRRAAPSTEYAANREPGRSAEEGYVPPGQEHDTAADLNPQEPPDQG
jgi:hypothetical protein